MGIMYINSYSVQPSWVLYSGNLVYMTSDNAPSPYVASLLTSVTSGSAWQVFDNASGTGIQASFFAALTLGLGAQILFGSNIRISKLTVRGNRSGQANWTCSVYGIKADNTGDILIHQATVAVNSDVVINSSDVNTPFKGLKVYCDTRTDLVCNIYSCQVTERYTQ